MKFLLGRKQNMTQYFDEDKGEAIPVTLVSVSPMTVTATKESEKDGYNAVQVGFEIQKENRLTKAILGHTKKQPFKVLKEFRLNSIPSYKIGDTISADTFVKGDTVSVRGISKGKGFQGVVKRHGFHGGRRTHGQKHSEREPGSIGGGLRNRVPKGMRMAGRMGNDLTNVKNLEIVDIDMTNNVVAVKGAIPGRKGTLIEILG